MRLDKQEQGKQNNNEKLTTNKSGLIGQKDCMQDAGKIKVHECGVAGAAYDGVWWICHTSPRRKKWNCEIEEKHKKKKFSLDQVWS